MTLMRWKYSILMPVLLLLACEGTSVSESASTTTDTARSTSRPYPPLDTVVIENGHILPPTEPGIGTSLLPDVLTRADATVVSSAL